ncbi:hypothetical protein CEXT_149181 [Caerostris extrusa]|uniref:Uncharacterized protein n=1 Tax=Caerostris extrusa TaxID=172846 RepID=A0AAV4Q7N6_CAEEX|nr:hypothetical protein CEXT_149181 [Caerostris extrusa]
MLISLEKKKSLSADRRYFIRLSAIPIRGPVLCAGCSSLTSHPHSSNLPGVIYSRVRHGVTQAILVNANEKSSDAWSSFFGELVD